MAKTLFIEILDDERLHLYDGEQVHAVTDASLPEWLNPTPNSDIILLDSLYVQSKTFTHPVKDKRILPQVIAADMADFLLQDASAYRFAYQEHHGVLWVSWLEKTRLQMLSQRFHSYLPRIKGLLSTPLLMVNGQSKSNSTESPFIVDSHPLTYVVRDGQTVVMRSEQASIWLNSLAETQIERRKLDNALLQCFRGDNVATLPNLWQMPNETRHASLPYLQWAGGIVLAMLLWGGNRYWDYRDAKQHNAALLAMQQDVLKQVFPNANSADPYGRLSAEHRQWQHHAPSHYLRALNEALNTYDLTLSEIIVDVPNQRVRLVGLVDQAVQKSLQKQGFTVDANDAGVSLSW